MKTLRRFFARFNHRGFQKVCSCGHTVSANLAFCPHCGARMSDPETIPED